MSLVNSVARSCAWCSAVPSGASVVASPREDCSSDPYTHGSVARLLRSRQQPNCAHSRRHAWSLFAVEAFHTET